MYKQHPSTSQPLTDLLLQKKVTEVNSSTLPITMMMMKGGGGGQVARIKCLFLRRVVSSLLPAGTALSSAVHFELFTVHCSTHTAHKLQTNLCTIYIAHIPVQAQQRMIISLSTFDHLHTVYQSAYSAPSQHPAVPTNHLHIANLNLNNVHKSAHCT